MNFVQKGEDEMKRAISAFLCITMILSLMTSFAFAETTDVAGITVTPEESNSAYAADSYQMTKKLPDVPRTIKAKIKLASDFSASSSAGVIVGNYSYGSVKYLNLSVETNGNPQIVYRENA